MVAQGFAAQPVEFQYTHRVIPSGEPPAGIGVSVFHLLVEKVGLAVVGEGQHGDPVQKLAADISRRLHAILGRDRDQPFGVARFEIAADLVDPVRIEHTIGEARPDARPEDFQREAAGTDDRDTEILRVSLERLAYLPAEIEAALPLAMFRMLFSAAAVAACVLGANPDAGLAQDAQIKRGQYLVTLGGCNDCHTPGYFFGKPDMARFLGGSEVGFEIPGLGVFHGPNLTPDHETGLGGWSTDQIVVAITKGRRPDGRGLAPIMPWHAFANLTAQDARAIAVYLKSLPSVKNAVPGPFGPDEQATSFVMKIVPPPAKTTEGTAQ